MQSEPVLHQESARWTVLDDDLNDLAEKATDLGIEVADVFQKAASTLVLGDSTGAHSIIESGYLFMYVNAPLQQQIADLLRNPYLTGEQLKRLVEIQQAASAWAGIGEKSRTLATAAIAFWQTPGSTMRLYTPTISQLLRALAKHIYIDMKRALVVFTSRDPDFAHLLQQDSMRFMGLYDQLQTEVRGIIRAENPYVVNYQMLIAACASMKVIVNYLSAIGGAIL